MKAEDLKLVVKEKVRRYCRSKQSAGTTAGMLRTIGLLWRTGIQHDWR